MSWPLKLAIGIRSEAPVDNARASRCLRIFRFDPGFRRTRAIGRVELLGNNPLQPELAGGGEHFVATAVR